MKYVIQNLPNGILRELRDFHEAVVMRDAALAIGVRLCAGARKTGNAASCASSI